MCQPFTGHLAAVAHGIEFGVIDGSYGLYIQLNNGRLNALGNRQHGGRQRIGGYEQKGDFHVGFAQ